MAINIWGGGEPWIRDGVRGEAISIKAAASPQTTLTPGSEGGNSTSGTYRWWTCEVWLVASAPGIRPVWVTSARRMTREKYLIPGLRVPVTISRRNPGRVRIEWAEVPKIDELIARGDQLFTNPDATRALIREAIVSAGAAPPPPGSRQEIDGPNARVISFGGGGTGQRLFTDKRKVDLLLSVAIPGRPRFGYRWQGKAPADRVVRPGTNIRVLYDLARPDEVGIPWDEVGVKMADMTEAARSIARAVRGDQAAPGQRTQRLLSGIGLDPGTLATVTAALNPASLRAGANYGAILQRLMATGVEMPATILSFTPGSQSIGGGRIVHLEMEVDPPHGALYPASFDQVLPPAIVSTLAGGQRVTVRVAADDPQTLMLWNTPHAADGVDPDTGRPLPPSGASATGERIGRLERIEQLRSSGALTEQEFQTLKARILTSPD